MFNSPVMVTPITVSNPPVPLSPSAAFQQLFEGNLRFLSKPRRPNQSLKHLQQQRQQNPFATLISCSDSRVTPEIIFDQGIGDLFIIRVAGNIISAAQMSSCEYGVVTLKTKVLVVLGHSECGVIKAALGNQVGTGYMGALIQAVEPSVAAARDQPGDRVKNTVRANILAQTHQLIREPTIAERLDVGAIIVVGAYFDMTSGKAEVVNIITCSEPSIRVNANCIF
jgi:carbonic anhydrase